MREANGKVPTAPNERLPVSEIVPRPMVLEEFAPLVGEEFSFDCTPAPIKLRLIEAEPLVDRGDVARPPFILVFHSGPDAMLLDGTYTVSHERLAPTAISIGSLMVPPTSQPGHYYQAVFN